MTPSQSVAALAARLLLSPIFLLSGTMKILTWSETAEHMQSEGMVAVPFFLAAAVAVELGAGLLLLLGGQTRLAAGALILFLIPVTLIFHDFWRYEEAARENQMQHFAKNVTIIGGLLMVVAAGAGAFSVDACLRKYHQRRDTEFVAGTLPPRSSPKPSSTR